MISRIVILILGWVGAFLVTPLFALTHLEFSGQMDIDHNEINLLLDLPVKQNFPTASSTSQSNSIVAKINKIDKQTYRAAIKLDYLKVLSYQLSSEMKINFDIRSSADNSESWVEGKLLAQYAMVDLKPIRDLSANFQIKNHRLTISDATFGNVTFKGSADAQSPYKLDLLFQLHEIEMTDFLRVWMVKNDYSASGKVTGVIKASGPMDKVVLKGNLESSSGFVDKLQFEKFLLNAEGIFPNMQIAKSTISQPNGMVFNLEGPIDLSDPKSFTKQLKALTFSPIVQDSSQERAWTIRRLKDEDFATTEIKYMLRKNNVDSTVNDGSSDMIGVERSLEF